MCQVGSVTQSSNRSAAGVSTDAATASFDGHNLAFTVTRRDGSGLQLDWAVHTAADAQVLRSAAEQGMAGRNLKPHRSSPIADRSEKTHVPGSGPRHGARQVERHPRSLRRRLQPKHSGRRHVATGSRTSRNDLRRRAGLSVLHAEDERHEVPDCDALSKARSRQPSPHLLSLTGIRRIMDAVLELPPAGSITPLTFHYILGRDAALQSSGLGAGLHRRRRAAVPCRQRRDPGRPERPPGISPALTSSATSGGSRGRQRIRFSSPHHTVRIENLSSNSSGQLRDVRCLPSSAIWVSERSSSFRPRPWFRLPFPDMPTLE